MAEPINLGLAEIVRDLEKLKAEAEAISGANGLLARLIEKALREARERQQSGSGNSG